MSSLIQTNYKNKIKKFSYLKGQTNTVVKNQTNLESNLGTVTENFALDPNFSNTSESSR